MQFPPLKKHKTFSNTVFLTEKNCFDGSILADEPGVFRCLIRKIGNDPDLLEFERKQNYAARRTGADDLALEVILELNSELPSCNSMRIGIPLSETDGAQKFTIIYSGTKFRLLANETLLDEDYPFGDPPGTPENHCDIPAEKQPEPQYRTTPLHCWSPDRLNEWVGDVSVGFFNDEYHIFYLYDRRHHKSKFGHGGHQWAHITTKDFKTWRDDGLILPCETQWQTFGTGTPFLLDGKLALAYGLHTERFLPAVGTPRGMTWAISEDGIHFTPSRISVEEMTENPSIYNQPDGSWIVYDHGLLCRAEKWCDFKKVAKKPIPCGTNSALLNSYECPSLFEWGGYYFMLVGFTGMYRSKSLSFETFDDLSGNGVDIYDGLKVPMVAPFKNNRMILSGWLGITGWGGVLGIRELVWFDDAIPGIRWLEEAMPEISDLQEVSASVTFSGEHYFEFTVQPEKTFSVTMEGVGKKILFSIDPKRKRATLSTEKECPTLCELGKNWRKISAPGFALDHLRNIETPYKVRMMIRNERKWNGCIVDVEIAGCRTLIHYFEGSHPTSCKVEDSDCRFHSGKIVK